METVAEKIIQVLEEFRTNRKTTNAERRATYYAAHPERVKGARCAAYHKDPKGGAAAKRDYLYGLSSGQFDGLLKDQDNKCAICGIEFIRTPCVDHNHVTGVVRGLLCRPCKSGIGNFHESKSALALAIIYLQKEEV